MIKMKILIINSYYFPEIIGGTEYSVKKLAENLVKLGNEVTVLCTGIKNEIQIINGVKIIRISGKNICKLNEYGKQNKFKRIIFKVIDFYNLFNYKTIKEILEKEKADIVHTNNFYGLSPIIWTISRKLKIPIIHTLRDYYIICPRINLISKSNGNNECTKPKKICELYRSIFKKLTRNINSVTAPSSVTLDIVLSENYFKKAHKKVIYNAIDYDTNKIKAILNNRKKEIENKKNITFVYLGALEKHKGILWLLESFSEINNDDIKLNIAGKGPLEDIVNNYTIIDNRIKYNGFCNEEKIEQLLLESDVLIIPSLWKEPFGRVILDAYKHCMPVIGSDKGAIPNLIRDKYTGTVIKSEDKEELKNAIIKYSNNKKIIINEAENVMEILSEFSIEDQCKKFIDLYTDIIEENNEKLNNK